MATDVMSKVSTSGRRRHRQLRFALESGRLIQRFGRIDRIGSETMRVGLQLPSRNLLEKNLVSRHLVKNASGNPRYHRRRTPPSRRSNN